MNIGVCTPYQPRDATYAALQVADVARCCGNQVSVYTTTPRRPPVHAGWDDRVVRGVPFTAWAAHLDAVIWAECPPVVQVRWCGRARHGLPRRRLVLIAAWDDTGAMVRDVYPEFTTVVAPSAAAGAFLADEAGAVNVREIPWSPRLPITNRPPPAPGHRPSVHVPLCDVRLRAHDPAAIVVVERLLRGGAAVDVRVSLNGRSGEVVRRLERRAREHPNLSLSRVGDFESLALALAEHDVTAVVATAESFGMTALCSLHAGTPVVAFDAPPLDEFVVGGQNGVLVPGVVTGRQPGTADPTIDDLATFATALAGLAASPAALGHVRTACAAGLATRAAAFTLAWEALLRED